MANTLPQIDMIPTCKHPVNQRFKY